MIEKPQKIAVLRANALGDFILTFPALYALREKFLEAEIVLLGRKLHSEFYGERSTPIDRIIALPNWLQFDESLYELSQEKEDFFRLLRDEEFDIAIQLHGGGRFSNPFIKKIRPKLSVGARTSDAQPLDINIPYTQYQHEILRQLNIVSKLNVNCSDFTPRIPVDEKDLLAARSLLTNLKVSSSFAILNPGATDPRRRWGIENFVEVARLMKKDDFSILINIGPNEHELEKFLNATFSEAEGIFLVKPTLSELSGLVYLSDLVVTNDTGTFHLSSAYSKPTVSLFWFGNLLNYGPLSSELHKVLVSWQTFCPICKENAYASNCCHEESLITNISPEIVYKNCQELLNYQGE